MICNLKQNILYSQYTTIANLDYIIHNILFFPIISNLQIKVKLLFKLIRYLSLSLSICMTYDSQRQM